MASEASRYITFLLTWKSDCDCREWNGEPIEAEAVESDNGYHLICPKCFMPWTVNVELARKRPGPR